MVERQRDGAAKAPLFRVYSEPTWSQLARLLPAPGGRIHQPYGLEAAGKRGHPFCLGVGSTTSYMATLRGGYIPRVVMPRQVLAACQGIHGFVSHDAHPPGPTNARLADRPPSSRA